MLGLVGKKRHEAELLAVQEQANHATDDANQLAKARQQALYDLGKQFENKTKSLTDVETRLKDADAKLKDAEEARRVA